MHLKYGNISEYDADRGMARVKLDGEDDIVTDWLQIIVRKAKTDKESAPLDVLEHVACILDEHLENGVILGAVYDEGNTPGDVKGKDITGVHFGNGCKVSYDRAANALTVEGIGDVSITCENATITPSGKVTIDGDAEITGTLDVTGKITASDEIEASGDISTAGDVVAAVLGPLGVHLSTHVHPTPSGPSGPPTNPS
jgi:phage baseplate assembly protein V